MSQALIEMADKASLDAIVSLEVRAQATAIAKAVPWPKGKKPYPFQEVGIAYAAMTGFRCLIGDSMGLGKTIQAIGCLNLGTRLARPLTPALVVAPASVLGSWENELDSFGVGFHVVPLRSGKERPPPPRRHSVYVTSWHLLPRLQDYLAKMRIRTLVFDESHTAKEAKAQWTKAAMRSSQRSRHVIHLSGTPAPNRPGELWTQLWMLDPETFENKHNFTQYLPEVLPCYMIRRLKTQVLEELPQKRRLYHLFDLPDEAKKTYQQAEEKMETLIAQSLAKRMLGRAVKLFKKARKRGVKPSKAAAWAVGYVNAEALSPEEIAQTAMVKIGHLRRTVGHLKVPVAVHWVKEHRAVSREPVVLFVEHRHVLKSLGRALSKEGLRWAYINGSTPNDVRTRRVKAFQAGKLDVFVCSQAAYAGITLTRASRMCFVERWWVPSREEQAEDRIHRIGQKQEVEITYLMASDTIDEYVTALVDLKRRNLDRLLGGERVQEEAETRAAEVPAVLTRLITNQLLQKLDSDFTDIQITTRMLKLALQHEQRKAQQRRRRRPQRRRPRRPRRMPRRMRRRR